MNRVRAAGVPRLGAMEGHAPAGGPRERSVLLTSQKWLDSIIPANGAEFVVAPVDAAQLNVVTGPRLVPVDCHVK